MGSSSAARNVNHSPGTASGSGSRICTDSTRPVVFDHNGANTSRVRVLPLPVNTPTQRACVNSSARSFSADSCRWYTRRTPVPVSRASKATNHQRGREERTHPTRTRNIVARIELSTPRTKAAIMITPPVRDKSERMGKEFADDVGRVVRGQLVCVVVLLRIRTVGDAPDHDPVRVVVTTHRILLPELAEPTRFHVHGHDLVVVVLQPMTYLGVLVGYDGLPGADQAVVDLEAAFVVPVHPAAEHGGFPLVGEVGVHRMDDAGRGLTFLTAALHTVCGRDLACVVVDDPGRD